MENVMFITIETYNYLFERSLECSKLEYQVKDMKKLLLQKAYEEAKFMYDRPLEKLLNISGSWFGLADHHKLYECGITLDEMY